MWVENFILLPGYIDEEKTVLGLHLWTDALPSIFQNNNTSRKTSDEVHG